jgi:hypothetical protein
MLMLMLPPIKASIDEFVQLYNAGDFDRIITSFYAENARQMPPCESICKGKEALLPWHKKSSTWQQGCGFDSLLRHFYLQLFSSSLSQFFLEKGNPLVLCLSDALTYL